MNWCRLRIRDVLCLAALLLVALAPSAAQAQGGIGGIGGGLGGGLGGGGLGGGGIGGGLGGLAGDQQAGVVIDAQGVLKVRRVADPGGLRAKRIIQEAMASLNPKLAQPSRLRKISLNRLERAVAAQVEKGEPLPDEMRYLAGMLRVQNVFFYPETGDIVLAGPAEGFAEDTVGRVRGLTTGRPVLELQDLVTSLRAYPPSGDKLNVISVSIDPTESGLANLQTFIKRGASQFLPGNPAGFAAGMRQSLGLQDVTVKGVAADTHFAQVMVEADYRMKLIGIGLEQPPVKIATFISAATPGALSGNALVRWYFVPEYKCIRVSDDGMAMQLEGWGVKLVGAQELVGEGGGRTNAEGESRASKVFCKSFTEQYPMLADREPVYAQLRNLIDLSVAAAFIQGQDYYERASWDLGVFGDESKYPVQTYTVPKQVESAVNVIVKGNAIMTPIGGGVQIRPLQALEQENRMADEDGKLSEAQHSVSLESMPEGQWWWD